MALGSGPEGDWGLAAAAAALAGACAFAAGALLLDEGLPRALAAAVLVGAAVFINALALLRRIAGSLCYPLAGWTLQPLPFDGAGPDELLLTERYQPLSDELLLDDALAPASADSRVVRLFEDRPARVSTLIPDASDALRNALLELRRTLR